MYYLLKFYTIKFGMSKLLIKYIRSNNNIESNIKEIKIKS